jgi:D-alanyl-D-alanine carboxypeptidase
MRSVAALDLVDRFHDSAGRAFTATVTLRQLLDHTSGLPNYFLHPSISDAVRHGGGRRRFTPLDLVDLAAAEAPPVAPPGSARTYTDTGFVLAGLIIEALTSRPLHEAYRELVLDPASMADTWLESSSEAPRRPEIASHLSAASADRVHRPFGGSGSCVSLGAGVVGGAEGPVGGGRVDPPAGASSGC